MDLRGDSTVDAVIGRPGYQNYTFSEVGYSRQHYNRSLMVRYEKSDGKNSFSFGRDKCVLEALANKDWVSSVQKTGTLHEVITERQKLHFDIDVTPDKFEVEWTKDNLDGMFVDIMDSIRDAWCEIYHLLWHVDHEQKDGKFKPIAVICDSSGEKKFSRHITLAGYCVANHSEAKYFYERCAKYFSDRGWNPSVIDPQVYGAKQRFTMVGFSNFGQSRPKRIISDHCIADTLVSYTADCELLPEVSEREQQKREYKYEEMSPAVRKGIDALDLSAFTGGEMRGSIMVFKRKKSSHCPVCDRVHDSMDMFLSWKGSCVYWHCFHADAKGKSKRFDMAEQTVSESAPIGKKTSSSTSSSGRPKMRCENRKVPIRDLIYRRVLG